MNYERLKTLAELLDKHHGKPQQYGFIVGPQSMMQLNEHMTALSHSDTFAHYQPMSGERLGIIVVTRDASAEKPVYTPTRLEFIPRESLTHAETDPMLSEYHEFIKSYVG